jgi:hypothetical protein
MRFLRELRQLRDEAGLELVELASRAHYSRDVIVAAEAGPSIPGLPVLSAYMRGCGGRLTEWEERWRSLTGSPAAGPCLPARPAGCSSLADAGARLGAAVSSAAEVPIPAQVMRRLSVFAGTVSAGTVSAGASVPVPVPAETAASVSAAGAVSHGSLLPAVGPLALPAARLASISRAALAATVTAVMVVLGTIFMLLRRVG